MAPRLFNYGYYFSFFIFSVLPLIQSQVEIQKNIVTSHVHYMLENVSLQCRINFQVITNRNKFLPQWQKRQPGEEDFTDITSAFFLKEDYVDPDRYEFIEDQDVAVNFDYQLIILRLEPKDSGEYKCRIKSNSNPDGEISITHNVTVRDPPTQVMMKGGIFKNKPETISLPLEQHIIMYYNSSNYFMCQASGGYPQPTIKVYVDGTKYQHKDTVWIETLDMELHPLGLSTELEGDQPAFKKPNVTYTMETSDFQVQRTAHGKQIKCKAFISQEDDNMSVKVEKTLIVYYKPLVSCGYEEFKFEGGNTNEQIVCNIEARPFPNIVKFYAKSSDENLIPGHQNRTGKLNEIRASHETGSGDGESRAILFFPKIEDKHFQQYQLTVSNEVGQNNLIITVKEGKSERSIEAQSQQVSDKDNDNSSAAYCQFSTFLIIFSYILHLLCSPIAHLS